MVSRKKNDHKDDLGISEKNEAVKVAIRCRPMNDKERSQGHTQTVQINRKRGEIMVQRPF